jgi:endoglucanase
MPPLFLLSSRSSAPARVGRALLVALFLAGTVGASPEPTESLGPGRYPAGSVVAQHGALKVIDRRLCDARGEPVVLRGVSTHDLKDFGRFASAAAVRALARDWGVTVLRPALYVPSYLADRSLEAKLDAMVQACEANGIYCLIDWHVLLEHTPQAHQDEAIAFFSRKAGQFRDKAHVLYEICNEPNGPDVTWREHVKPYAEAVIPAIRERAPDSVIVVGTPTWSQDVDIAARDPLPFANLLYAVHFYAGSHKEELREKVRVASRRIAIFCSEWGTTLASGDGGPFPEESTTWLDFLERDGISWCNWSLSDAREASALFVPGSSADGGWTDRDLTPSGRYVRARLAQPVAAAPAEKRAIAATDVVR